MTKRERLVPVIRQMRADGFLLREIADHLGLAVSTVHDYDIDPTGEKAKARKLKAARPCVGCGKTINRDGERANPAERCVRCEGQRQREMSREWILSSLAEWFERFGEEPTAMDWNPGLYQRSGTERTYGSPNWRAASDRPWPSTTLCMGSFGSWNATLRAGGFSPRAVGQRRDVETWRRNMEAARHRGPRHPDYDAARLMLEDGHRPKDIARELNIPLSTIYQWGRQLRAAA